MILDNSLFFLYNKRVSELYGSVDAGFQYIHEESPSIAGQGCRITSGEGDFRDSATERYRESAKAPARMERRGKSSPAAWRLAGYVNPTRCKIDCGTHVAARHVPG